MKRKGIAGMKRQSLLNSFIKNALTTITFVKTITAVALLFFYAHVFSFFLPKGINHVFVTKLSKWLFMLIAALSFICIIYFYLAKKKSLKYTSPAESIHIGDLFLSLLPMAAIVRYILLNQNILSVFDSIIVFAIFFFIACVLTFFIPMLVGRFGSRKILMLVGLSFSWVLFNMASLSCEFSWHLSGNFVRQCVILAVVFAILVVIYSLNRKLLYIMAVAFLAAGILTSPISRSVSFADISEIYTYTKGKVLKRKPDIFLLAYESYVENETMLKYGIDNSAQEDYLAQNGFHLYKGTYSLGADSKTSMNLVLNIFRDPPTQSSRADKGYLFNPKVTKYWDIAVAGNGAVQNILKANGYITLGIFPYDYYFLGTTSFYDQTFPAMITPSYQLLAKSIFEGEFRFDAGFYEVSRHEYLSKKMQVLSLKSDQPRFLYTHSKVPGHSQNSGKALGNETEIYKKGLIIANEEMRKDIETINKHSPNAIIIVFGDHGPYLTKNCTSTSFNNEYDISEVDRLDIQDRFGSFLAIKWPKDANIDHNKIEILQDIFPSVFAYLYDDTSILNSRVEQLTVSPFRISGIYVRNGIIEGGKDDGKLLFDSMKER